MREDSGMRISGVRPCSLDVLFNPADFDYMTFHIHNSYLCSVFNDLIYNRNQCFEDEASPLVKTDVDKGKLSISLPELAEATVGTWGNLGSFVDFLTPYVGEWEDPTERTLEYIRAGDKYYQFVPFDIESEGWHNLTHLKLLDPPYIVAKGDVFIPKRFQSTSYFAQDYGDEGVVLRSRFFGLVNSNLRSYLLKPNKAHPIILFHQEKLDLNRYKPKTNTTGAKISHKAPSLLSSN